MTVPEFIGEKAVYDRDSQVIFGQRGEGLQMIAQFHLDVRAWAAFQKLFKTPQEAAAFQDKLGQFIADAINDKLAQEKKDNTQA